MTEASPAAASRELPGEKEIARTGFARPGSVSVFCRHVEGGCPTRKRVEEPAGLVVEDVNGAALMSARREPAVTAEVDADAEAPCAAASRLVLLYLGGLGPADVPDVDASVKRGAGEEAPVLAERDGPDLARVGGLFDLCVQVPLARLFRHRPDLDLAAEAGARRYLAIPRGREVVAAQLVRAAYRLGDRVGLVGRVVNVNRGGAAGGEQGSGRGGQGEDIGYVGCGGSVEIIRLLD